MVGTLLAFRSVFFRRVPHFHSSNGCMRRPCRLSCLVVGLRMVPACRSGFRRTSYDCRHHGPRPEASATCAVRRSTLGPRKARIVAALGASSPGPTDSPPGPPEEGTVSGHSATSTSSQPWRAIGHHRAQWRRASQRCSRFCHGWCIRHSAKCASAGRVTLAVGGWHRLQCQISRAAKNIYLNASIHGPHGALRSIVDSTRWSSSRGIGPISWIRPVKPTTPAACTCAWRSSGRGAPRSRHPAARRSARGWRFSAFPATLPAAGRGNWCPRAAPCCSFRTAWIPVARFLHGVASGSTAAANPRRRTRYTIVLESYPRRGDGAWRCRPRLDGAGTPVSRRQPARRPPVARRRAGPTQTRRRVRSARIGAGVVNT